MKTLRALLAILAMVIALAAGCNSADSPSATASTSPRDLVGHDYVEEGYITEDQLLRIHALAEALAKAMSDPAARVLVRDAMRFSTYSEHKVVIQELFHDPHYGSALGVLVRAKAGIDDLHSLISGLPPLDFYVLDESDRRTWRATSDVVVGLVVDVDAPEIDFYDIGGGRSHRIGRSGIPEEVILILHPAERKGILSEPITTPGDVVDEAGNRSFLTPAELCEGIECSGGGGATSGLRFDRFEIYYDGDFWGGDAEMEFQFYYCQGNHPMDCDQPAEWLRATELFYPNVSHHEVVNSGLTIWYGDTPLGGINNRYIYIDIHEDDWYEDEHWPDGGSHEEPVYNYEGIYGVLHAVIGTCFRYFNDQGDPHACDHAFEEGLADGPYIDLQFSEF